MMKALIVTAIPSFPSSSKLKAPLMQEPVTMMPRFDYRLRKNGEVNVSFRVSSKMGLEDHGSAEISKSSNIEETKHSDIWELFREAQQNILYLHKQRVKAMEELKKTKKEKQLLLDKVAQLQAKIKPGVGKVDYRLSFCWEVLLRVDSMVLAGMISTGEASNLRRLVMDHKVSIADFFTDIMQKKDAVLLAELRQFSDKRKKNAFHVVHICTEMAPVMSVGSLASYITGLSCALQRRGYLVEVILPKYASLKLDEIQGLREIEAEFYSYFNGQLHGNRIWNGIVCGVGLTLIEPQYYSTFFNRERVYGYSDDFERFTYFSRASLDYIVKSGKQPDVVHIHNWETAIVGPLFWDIFAKQFQALGGTRILLTCHDFHMQCLEQPDKLALCGLDPARLHRSDRLQDNTKTHLINILKGGVVYSNKVVVMSSLHSKSMAVQSPSHGLEPTLNIHKDKLVVAPFGFDSSTWDPSNDNFIPKKYSGEDLKGKAACKTALQQQLGLSLNASTILVGCILSDASVDPESLKAVIRNFSRMDVQFVIAGISKVPTAGRDLDSFQELKEKDVRLISRYDEALSHLIFAGSDIIMCQSFYDPIHQVPLKALRYGAAPIAVSFNNYRIRHLPDHEAGRITKFTQFISSTFGNMSVSQAVDEIRMNPSEWKQKVKEGMAMDFSWDAECCDIHVSAYAAISNL